MKHTFQGQEGVRRLQLARSSSQVNWSHPLNDFIQQEVNGSLEKSNVVVAKMTQSLHCIWVWAKVHFTIFSINSTKLSLNLEFRFLKDNDWKTITSFADNIQVLMKSLLYDKHCLLCVVNIQIKNSYSIANWVEMMMAWFWSRIKCTC